MSNNNNQLYGEDIVPGTHHNGKIHLVAVCNNLIYHQGKWDPWYQSWPPTLGGKDRNVIWSNIIYSAVKQNQKNKKIRFAFVKTYQHQLYQPQSNHLGCQNPVQSEHHKQLTLQYNFIWIGFDPQAVEAKILVLVPNLTRGSTIWFGICKGMWLCSHKHLEKAQNTCKEMTIFCCNQNVIIPLPTMEGFFAVEDISIELPVHNRLIVDFNVLELHNLPYLCQQLTHNWDESHLILPSHF